MPGLFGSRSRRPDRARLCSRPLLIVLFFHPVRYPQEGTDEKDDIWGAAAAADGSTFLFGTTEGSWATESAGDEDFAVAKISSNGTLLWRWQVRMGRAYAASATRFERDFRSGSLPPPRIEAMSKHAGILIPVKAAHPVSIFFSTSGALA